MIPAAASPKQDTHTAEHYPALISSNPTKTVNSESVVIGYYEFPSQLTTVNGKAIGPYADTTRRLMKEAGLRYKFVQMPIGRLYNEVAKGADIQVWLAILFPKFLKIGIPIKPTQFSAIRLSLFAMPGNKPPPLRMLQNEPLIIIVGYTYGGLLKRYGVDKKNVALLNASNHLSAFKMLHAGRAPYILNYEEAMQAVARDNIGENLAAREIERWQVHMFVTKTAPNADLLAEKLAAASSRIAQEKAP